MAPNIAPLAREADPAADAPVRHPLRQVINALRSNMAIVAVAVATPLSAHAMLSPASAEAGCVTTHTVDSDTTVCGPDVGDTPPAGDPSTPSTPDSPSQGQPDKPSHNKPKHPSTKPEEPKKLYSYDMCGGWGGRICTTGCGDVVSADVASDLTGRRITPLDVLPILSPDYYIPGSGTRPEAFSVIARRFSLHEKAGNLKSAERAIGELGGVAVAEFNNGVAIERSGHSSSVAVDDHYVVLDKLRNGKFAMADPHQGAGRYNERTRSGKTRFWTGHQMKQEGLINVWTVTP